MLALTIVYLADLHTNDLYCTGCVAMVYHNTTIMQNYIEEPVNNN